jgi:hypothetical protein
MILATQEAETGRIVVQIQPEQKFRETPSQPIKANVHLPSQGSITGVSYSMPIQV